MAPGSAMPVLGSGCGCTGPSPTGRSAPPRARRWCPARPWAVALGQTDPAAAIRGRCTRAGVDRVVEVALSENGELDASVVANDAVIAIYSSRSDRIDLPFLPLLFANVTLRLLGSDDFSFPAKQQAARDFTTGELGHPALGKGRPRATPKFIMEAGRRPRRQPVARRGELDDR